MGQTKEQKILKQLSGGTVQRKTAIASDMFLPNHSGDHSAGIVNSTPTNDTDLPNKKYVDDAIDTDITTHINTAQAHSDYLLNNASDTMTGTLTASGFKTFGSLNFSNNAYLTYGAPDDKLEFIGASIYDFDGDIYCTGDTLYVAGVYSYTQITTDEGITASGAISGGSLSISAGQSTMSSSSFPVLKVTRTHSTTSSGKASLLIANDATSVSLGDGTGPGMLFQWNDNTATSYSGSIYTQRAGADNSHALVFNTYTAGSNTLGMRLYGGKLRLGSNVNATHTLDVTGDATIGDGGTTNYTEIKTDGEINLHGTARVKTGQWIGVTGLKAPGTKPAIFKESGISGVWEFSDGTDDTIVFNFKIPENMDRSVAPSLIVGWSTNTAVTNETAVWQLEYLWTAPGEDTTAAAQETLTVDSNAIAQANGLIVAEITGIDLPSSTDVCMHCRLKRLGADADDDLTDTAELHGVCLSYTSNKLGEAT